MIYLVVLTFLFLLSFHFDICGKKKNKGLWYLIVLCIFILLAGLRWRVGVDTIRYLDHFYHDYPSLKEFNFKDYVIGKDPLYVLLNSVIRSIGGRFYVVQLIQATFVNVLIFKYFKKHSSFIFTCCLFYFLIAYVFFSMGIMRAGFSIAISLFAFDYFLEKKWIKGYFLLFIALMFHAQTLAVFFFPLFFSLHLNKKGWIILLGAYLIGFVFQEFLSDYIILFESNESLGDKLSDYLSEGTEFGKNTRNLNYFIIRIFPNLIYPLFALWYTKKNCKKKSLEHLESLVVLGVVFVLIEIHFLIAYRYVDYFLIIFAIFFSETSVTLVKKSKKLGVVLGYIKTMIFFLPTMIFFVYIISIKDPSYIYSSVINKQINQKKEDRFREMGMYTYSSPNYNEY